MEKMYNTIKNIYITTTLRPFACGFLLFKLICVINAYRQTLGIFYLKKYTKSQNHSTKYWVNWAKHALFFFIKFLKSALKYVVKYLYIKRTHIA